MGKNFKNSRFLKSWTRQKFSSQPGVLTKFATVGKTWHLLRYPTRTLIFWIKFGKNLAEKYRFRLVLFLILLVILAKVSKNLIPNLPIFSNNLVIGVVGEYTFDNLPQSLTQLYSAGLTKFDKTGQVIPALAKSWETQDGKKFKFTLKDNLFWQDGKKLKAQDLQFQIPNVQVKVLDEATIEFALADIFSPYPATLTKPLFRQKTQIGTGPYKLAKTVKDGSSLRQISLRPKGNNLPQITIRFFPNSQNTVTAYKSGRIGVIFNLMRPNGLENWKGSEIVKTSNSSRLVAVFYNTKDELLSSQKFRKALDLTIDRSSLPNQAAGPYPSNSWMVNSNLKPVFDLKRGQKIIKDEKINPEKITLLTPTVFEEMAAKIANGWEQLGIKVKIEKIDKVPENFQAAIFGLEISQDPDQYSFWHSTQSGSLTKIEDPKLDKLLEDGRKLINPEERKVKYLELQKELQELVPASFLFFPDRYIVINKNSQKKLDQIKKLFPEFPLN